jgi:hypothetical protein
MSATMTSAISALARQSSIRLLPRILGACLLVCGSLQIELACLLRCLAIPYMYALLQPYVPAGL